MSGFRNFIADAVSTLGCLACGKPPDARQAFELLYSVKKDPWNYEQSDYEKDKYATTLAMIKGQKYHKALEVGCSEGVFTGMMAEYADFIDAVDISPTALSRAEKRNAANASIKFFVMDVEKNQPDSQYNLIVCSEVLYYLDEIDRMTGVADRFAEWLVPGGHLLLAHMRRTSDDVAGYPPPPLGYPSKGARTVHGVFRSHKAFRLLRNEERPLYEAVLFEKISS